MPGSYSNDTHKKDPPPISRHSQLGQRATGILELLALLVNENLELLNELPPRLHAISEREARKIQRQDVAETLEGVVVEPGIPVDL